MSPAPVCIRETVNIPMHTATEWTMATPPGLDLILKQVRQRAAAEGSDASDGELLRRFGELGEEFALEALVGRHGSLVYGVCRRILGNEVDAEDAFQATFLVLARKAATLGRHTSLAGWLHTVANRIALRARVTAARRRAVVPPTVRPSHDPLAEMTARELCSVLDEELGRLPDKYRLPLLLCCLEGRTRDEAARELNWSLGALKGRLERGRELLRTRLDRRGVCLSAVLLHAGLTSAPVSARLVSATSQAVAALLASGGVGEHLGSGTGTVFLHTMGNGDSPDGGRHRTPGGHRAGGGGSRFFSYASVTGPARGACAGRREAQRTESRASRG